MVVANISEFFKDDVIEPFNIFHFGLLLCFKNKNPEHCYLVSLGKSHFYLNKFIEHDFGIKVAMRIANDENILLKKVDIFVELKNRMLHPISNLFLVHICLVSQLSI